MSKLRFNVSGAKKKKTNKPCRSSIIQQKTKLRIRRKTYLYENYTCKLSFKTSPGGGCVVKIYIKTREHFELKCVAFRLVGTFFTLYHFESLILFYMVPFAPPSLETLRLCLLKKKKKVQVARMESRRGLLRIEVPKKRKYKLGVFFLWSYRPCVVCIAYVSCANKWRKGKGQ